MSDKFEVYEDRAGKFWFRLKSDSGEIVAVGEVYESKVSAKNGCEAVVRAATGAPIVEFEGTHYICRRGTNRALVSSSDVAKPSFYPAEQTLIVDSHHDLRP